MAIERRQFLALLGGAALSPWLPVRAEPPGLIIGCRSTAEARHSLAGVDQSGQTRFDIPLPARGHGMTRHPISGDVVVCARRPGEFLWVIDPISGQLSHKLQAAPGRHFYGHGVFDKAGQRLYCTENDFEAGRGVIGVYAVRSGYARIGELPSHGIGPHELKMLSDNRTLVIANGGIKTHPDFGRAKLNLAEMAPNLAYVDRHSGELLEKVEPPAEWRQLSIRHLDVNAQDQVVAVMQYQGDPRHRPPLIALHQRGQALDWCRIPESLLGRFKNYCGSVCWDGSGQSFAVSSPRGGLITAWRASDGSLGGHWDVPDGCGVAPTSKAGRFLVSAGTGQLLELGPHQRPRLVARGKAWDNHLLS